MKILLLGKGGNVGQELQRTLLPFGDVTALCRQDVDLEDIPALNRVLSSQAPDVIVNAAAYTAVDQAESNANSAHRINAEAVAAMADDAKRRDALLVHYSTDYVFDGDKTEPYIETDGPNPLSVYGRSKLAGEVAIQESGCQALVLRTSWVYSSHGSNFVKTILRLAAEREELRIVADQFGAPTAAEMIADVTALAIAGHRSAQLPNGVYHLAATGSTTWHGLACHIVRRARQNGAPLKVDFDRITPIKTEEYPVPAKRPKNSRLNTDSLMTALRLEFPHWTVHADRVIDQLTKRDTQL
ncbi:dTDP-4-dehydrorhamnose reductase [Achromobacter xylosoxidans]|jgi:dTDP-4-dehydrorhamnose reductase|uniref:dTDP-4-dehydrorhamnose reductase n=1 Tax=Alcaligenes xylosoxydans xylosoxydans TaxID=85698 RepID=A0A9X3R2J4_ALCXX|nr:dTDP-4-dehydrorhamnose reductase [Achromobacter xylosoxidans]MCZ8400546.1 dTDP-4-dehydrorhamnose reductase [Achromobacter xylosoxidans]CUJ56158.1 dTDP-4-dehydrorhamnose reductase [Achromobacter xylosoxidans]